MFIIIHIQIQTHTVIGHKVGLHMLNLNIIFTMMTSHIFIRQFCFITKDSL